MIDEVLDEGWSRDRLARHDICILRAGICELQDMPHIPVRAVLSEYAGMAEVFQSDVAFINAVMDRHAHTLRTEELAAQK
jgi:N utilization substance protein B